MRAWLVVLVACGGGTTSRPVAQSTTNTTAVSTTPTTTNTQPSQPSCDHAPRRVVVFDIEAVDASSQTEAHEFSQQMTISDPCIDLRPASTTLTDAKRTMNCRAEHPMCMSAIGVQEAADVLVFGRAERSRGNVTVTVRSLDIAKRQIIATVNKPLDASTDLGLVARETVVALLMP